MAIEAPETQKVDSPIVACDGGEGALGHPRVYLNMESRGEIQCPYCGKLYILEEGAHAHAH
ncbi:zinc-finger domain-containing protein [Zavarzinia compransoris]|uniref:Zinc-finger domain-containing protein n=1 Tax=Zavarzinia compransoris TaxID=1264899 RepID=A0A317DW76_9PROT|nr:zinc-finger domain-containing protein [Zavarzinia compransoris]PWR18781.1 zinc-finger domain-containing protein [Zavarzinia compransoris]TDP48766.1 putative Zn-finger protein [Zavarzinia compransoris]